MNISIKELLNKICAEGFKAYIVGGYVRDLILGINNDDVDIVTNAPVEKLMEIFSSYKPVILKYNTLNFKFINYNIDIAQMRKESFDGHYTTIIFTSNLADDYARRDFTINGIYMDENGEYYDFDTGVEDCKNRNLKFIGDPIAKCLEDPSRIIRAIYFILKYNLKPCDDLFKIDIDTNTILKVDVYLMNKIIIKSLKIGKNREFVELLNKCNLYKKLFHKECQNYDVKPIDFLINNEYIFLDSVINKN